MEWRQALEKGEGGRAWQRSLGTCRPQTMSLVLAFALLLPLLFAQQPERERGGGAVEHRTVKREHTRGGGRVVANGS